jgi:hypothetical protein
MKRFLFLGSLSLVFCVLSYAQTPTSTPPVDKHERVETEGIKLNLTAVDRNGNFVPDVKKEELVITEDGRLHQANSVHSIAASVLIAMDNGGEVRQKKNIATTRSVAKKLVGELRDGTKIALMQFHDRVEFLSDWILIKATF